MNHRWHFSVWHLLVLTTIVSCVMLIAVKWTPLFLVGGFWLVYVVAMFGVFHLTSERRSPGATLVWLLSGAALLLVAAFNLFWTYGGPSHVVTTTEWTAKIVVSLVLGCIGVAGLYRARRAYVGAKAGKARLSGDGGEL